VETWRIAGAGFIAVAKCPTHYVNMLNSTHQQQQSLNDPSSGQPGEPAPELSETLTQYNTLVVLKFFTSTPNLPPRPPSQSTSNTEKNLQKTALRNMKNLRTRTHTSFIFVLL